MALPSSMTKYTCMACSPLCMTGEHYCSWAQERTRDKTGAIVPLPFIVCADWTICSHGNDQRAVCQISAAGSVTGPDTGSLGMETLHWDQLTLSVIRSAALCFLLSGLLN